jgi:hypothetical protein
MFIGGRVELFDMVNETEEICITPEAQANAMIVALLSQHHCGTKGVGGCQMKPSVPPSRPS